ncbi:hypothetical protein MOMA_02355 [Moraxella macacae 0408225]|uniref:Putative membrane protein insertion efficiency factor n=1 Tax=Moraxella macacae 0408225 TaxID=1230338 RepID=L2F8I5_9GAMM|nr:membrane protein insertion efficiency factor YidD [Moraxella macacae]ELA09210.1 hypothetical protein MOMA_02355 [Moraxella macacae 0408225]
MKRLLDKVLSQILFGLIVFYRYAISPLLPARCRFYPTCSAYGLEAVRLHGGVYGGWLTVCRICRCHPWGGFGVDFVPLPLYRYRFEQVSVLPNGYFVRYWQRG